MNLIIILSFFLNVINGTHWNEFNLWDKHLNIFFRNSIKLKEACIEDNSCPYKVRMIEKKMYASHYNINFRKI